MSGVFGRIVRHEWRGLVADRTAWLTIAIFGLLVGYGISNGARWARFQARTIDSATADAGRRLWDLKRWIDSMPLDAPPPGPFGRDPRSPASVGGRDGAPAVVLPPGPLAALAVGQSDLLPYHYPVSMRSKQSFVNAQEIENPGNLLEGRFDLAFVIVSLFPLLILALSYNLLAGEREQGTLALVASQPVSVGRHLAAKVLVRGALIGTIGVGVTLGGLAATGLDFGGEGVAVRLLLWLAVVAGYGAFWFALALLVNAGTRSSAANATILAGVWLVLVVVAPAVLNVAVKAAHPVPSRLALIGAMRTASNEASAKGAALLAKVYGDHPELAPAGQVEAGEFMARTYAVQDEVDRQVAPLLARFDEQLDKQQALAERYRFASPAVVAQAALTDLGGTGTARYRHWQRQVDAFHQRWQSFFIPRAFRREWLRPSDYRNIPRYEYVDEPVGQSAGRVLLGLLGLGLPSVLIGALALHRLRRYQVAG